MTWKAVGKIDYNLKNILPDSETPLNELSGNFGFELRDGAIKGFDLQAVLLKIDKAAKLHKGLTEELDLSSFQKHPVF